MEKKAITGCQTNRTKGDSDRHLHSNQMGAFYYTCAILLIYAALILYVMLKQVLSEGSPSEAHRFRRKMSRREERKKKEEAEVRGYIKNQLCVHLIKMGQMGRYLSVAPHFASPNSRKASDSERTVTKVDVKAQYTEDKGTQTVTLRSFSFH